MDLALLHREVMAERGVAPQLGLGGEEGDGTLAEDRAADLDGPAQAADPR